MAYRFERGTATGVAGRMVIESAGGREEVADPPDAASLPLRAVLASMETGEPPACTIGNALQHTACIEAGFAAAPPAEVPAEFVLTATAGRRRSRRTPPARSPRSAASSGSSTPRTPRRYASSRGTTGYGACR